MPAFTISRGGKETYTAVAQDGTVLGFATLSRTLHGRPLQSGRRFVELRVAPQARGQGIGGALYTAVERSAQWRWVSALACAVAPDDAVALAFATRRGFKIEHRMMDGELDLRRFDPAPWAGAVAAAESRGVRFTTLLQAQDDRDVLKNLYELDQHCSRDVPDWSGVMPSFEEYCKDLSENDPAGSFLAWDGAELVGFSLSSAEADGTGYTGFLGVARAYRGKGIALALKLLTIQWAQARGFTRLCTNNNAANESILGLNRKLGYSVKPGHIYLVKSVFGLPYVAQSAGTFALFVGLYVWWQDWWHGVALGAIVLTHEWGHRIGARRRGVRLIPPAFVPFVGAVVRCEKHPANPVDESFLAAAGPAAGLVATGVVWAVGALLHSSPLLDAAYLGFLMQIVQLLPFAPLDGGRMFCSTFRWLWYLLAPIGAYFALLLHQAALVLVAATPLYEALKAEPTEESARVPATSRVAHSLAYLVLISAAIVGVWRVGNRLNGGPLARWFPPQDSLEVWTNVVMVGLAVAGYLIYRLIRYLGWLTPFKPDEPDLPHSDGER